MRGMSEAFKRYPEVMRHKYHYYRLFVHGTNTYIGSNSVSIGVVFSQVLSLLGTRNQAQAVSASHLWHATVSLPEKWIDDNNNWRCAQWIEWDRCSARLSSSIA